MTQTKEQEITAIVPCKKCGHKTVLATSLVTYFDPDQEPYESGVFEKAELETIYMHVMVGIHYCEKCEELNDVWIEEPQLESVSTQDEIIKLIDDTLDWCKDLYDRQYHRIPYIIAGLISGKVLKTLKEIREMITECTNTKT